MPSSALRRTISVTLLSTLIAGLFVQAEPPTLLDDLASADSSYADYANEIADPSPAVHTVSISSAPLDNGLTRVSLGSDLLSSNKVDTYTIRDADTLDVIKICHSVGDCVVDVDASLHPKVYAEASNVKSEVLNLTDGYSEPFVDDWNLQLSVDKPTYNTTTDGDGKVRFPTWKVSGKFPERISTRGDSLEIVLEYVDEGQLVDGRTYPGLQKSVPVKSYTIAPSGDVPYGENFSFDVDYGFAAETTASYNVLVYSSYNNEQYPIARSSAEQISIIDYTVSGTAVAGTDKYFSIMPNSNNPMYVKLAYPGGDNYGYSYVIHEINTGKYQTYSRCGVPELTYKIWCGAQPNTPITMNMDVDYTEANWEVEVLYGIPVCDTAINADCRTNGPGDLGLATSVQSVAISERITIPKNLGIVDGYQSAGGYNPSSSQCIQACAADPVNTQTGEYWENITDIEPMNAFTPPLSFIRNYASNSSSEDRGLGKGWSTGYDMKLESTSVTDKRDVKQLETVSVRQENGSSVQFKKLLDSRGNTFYSAIHTPAKLELVDDKFLFTRINGATFEFDSTSGLLTKQINSSTEQSLLFVYDEDSRLNAVTSSNGQSINLNWADSHISRVTTSTGLEVAYHYTGNNLTQVTDYAGREWRYKYGSDGRLSDKTNPNGGMTSNNYDESGRVKSQSDPIGGVTTFTYETTFSGGLNTTVKSPSLNTTYTYNSIGQAQSVTKNYSRWSYGYNNNGQIIAISNPDGTYTTYTYDAQGNAITSTDELGNTSKSGYNELNLPTYREDANGNRADFTYDDNGALTSFSDPAGNITHVTTQKGLTQSVTSPLGNSASYTYDSNGFVLTATEPTGVVTTYVRDVLGRVVSVTDAKGSKSAYTYDRANNLTSTEDASGAKTQFTYDASDNVIKTTDALGSIEKFEYDALNRVIKATDALGYVTTKTYPTMLSERTVNPNKTFDVVDYDGVSGVAHRITKNGQIISSYSLNWRGQPISEWSWNTADYMQYTYDYAGQLVKTIDAMKRETRYEYNKAQQLVSSTQVSSTGNLVTKYDYDSIGQMVQVTLPDGRKQTAQYDSEGNQTKYIDESGVVASYLYDANSRVTKFEEGPASWSLEYDAVGNIAKRINNQDSSFAEMQYDSRDLLVNTKYSDNTPSVSVRYDAIGRTEEVVDAIGKHGYQYDRNSNLQQQLLDDVNVLTYTYDKADRLSTMSYESKLTVAYGYNSFGQMSSVSGTWGSVGYSYSQGRVSAMTRNGGASVPTSYARDLSQELKSVSNGSGRNALSATSLQRNDVGLISNKQVSSTPSPGLAKSDSYTYDQLSRVTGVASGRPVVDRSVSYELDGSISKTTSGVNLSYNDIGQVISARGDITAHAVISPSTRTDSAEYSYDARGNRATATFAASGTQPVKQTAYTYNVADQLVTVNNAPNAPPESSYETQYLYDANGLLGEKKDKSPDKGLVSRQKFIWDITTEIPTMLSDGYSYYVYGVGTTPIAQVKKGTSTKVGNTTEYLLTDDLGSVIQTVSNNGTVTGSKTYDEYGVSKQLSSVSGAGETRFGFAGEYEDVESGFVYLRARWYDPQTAQFTSVDPALASTHLSYGYTEGNPLSYTDPLGLDAYNGGQQFNLGVANSLSFGAIEKFSDNFMPGLIDRCDKGAYSWGNNTGDVVSLVIPGAGLIKAAKSLPKLTVSPATRELVKRLIKEDRGSAPNPFTALPKMTNSQTYKAIKDAAQKIQHKTGPGTVYLRTDPNTGNYYVGKSKSEKSYLARQAAHNRKLPQGQEYIFERLARSDGRELGQIEEYLIRAGNGPLSRGNAINASLENKIFAKSPNKYDGGW